MSHNEDFLKIVNDSKTRIQECTIEDVVKKKDAGESFHFVDTREDREWEKGRCEGAIHLGKGVIERDIGKAIPNKDDQIILYCGGGFRSALAAENLMRMGYTNVISMDGGIRRWKEMGLPLEND